MQTQAQASTLATAATPPDPRTQLALTDFIEEFGEDLMEALNAANPPVYAGCCTPTHARRQAVMDGLKRRPFAAQAEAVQTAVALLADQGEQAAIINAEMGTGKTLMAIAAAAVLHNEGAKRFLVIAPPHLVYKWRREILETVENAKVWVLNGADTLAKLLQLRETLPSGGWGRPESRKSTRVFYSGANPHAHGLSLETFVPAAQHAQQGYHGGAHLPYPLS